MLWRAVHSGESRFAAPTAWLALALAAFLAAPVVHSQQPTAKASAGSRPTHTVKRGDTLWDIARTYLRDPFLWPEIYRLNTSLIQDPHWIYPGEILALPGDAPPPMVAAADHPTADQPTADQPSAEPATADVTGPTIFAKRTTPAVEDERGVAVSGQTAWPKSVVRIGEYVAAPFVVQRNGPGGTGKILHGADLPGIAQGTNRGRLLLYDKILIGPPAGSAAARGERYVTFRFGPYIENLGQVVIPTGVIEVVRAAGPGDATVAQIVKMFQDVSTDQLLMRYDSAAPSITGQPHAIAVGPVARVQWIKDSPLLPNLQNYLVLGISAREGVKIGDQFELFRPRQAARELGELADPETSIGTAQVVRVTPFATTVIITAQDQPKIEMGTMARLSAKMP